MRPVPIPSNNQRRARNRHCLWMVDPVYTPAQKIEWRPHSGPARGIPRSLNPRATRR